MCAEFAVRAIGVGGAKGGNGIGDGVNGTVKAARCGRDEHGVDVGVLMTGVQGARVGRRTPTDQVHMGIGKSGIRSGGSDRRTDGNAERRGRGGGSDL
jgi:hypothetical protein